MLHLTAYTRLKQDRHCLPVHTHTPLHTPLIRPRTSCRQHTQPGRQPQLSAATNQQLTAAMCASATRTTSATAATTAEARSTAAASITACLPGACAACICLAKPGVKPRHPHSNTLGQSRAHHTPQQHLPNKVSWTACFDDHHTQVSHRAPHKPVNYTQRGSARRFTAMHPARQETHTHPLCCCCPLVKTTHARTHTVSLYTHFCAN